MEKISNRDLKTGPELDLGSFAEHILNKEILDSTIEDMFWDFYNHGNPTDKAEALTMLEKCDREDLTLKIAERIKKEQV